MSAAPETVDADGNEPSADRSHRQVQGNTTVGRFRRRLGFGLQYLRLIDQAACQSQRQRPTEGEPSAHHGKQGHRRRQSRLPRNHRQDGKSGGDALLLPLATGLGGTADHILHASSEHGAGPHQPPFHRGHGDPQKSRNVLLRTVLEVKQQQDLAILRAQTVERLPQDAVLLRRLQQVIRPFEGHLFQQLWIVGHRGPVRLPLPQPCLRPVQGDAPEPRAELAAVTQIGQLLERLDEDVLYEILDFVRAAHLVQDDPMDEAKVALDQVRKSFAVAAEGPIDECWFGCHGRAVSGPGGTSRARETRALQYRRSSREFV